MGEAFEGRGFRRTGDTGEKGLKAAGMEGRRCTVEYSVCNEGGEAEA